MKKKIILIFLASIISIFLFYFIAFHGDISISHHFGGEYSQDHYHYEQYFFNKLIKENKWNEPEGEPNPPNTVMFLSKKIVWRGLDGLFKWKKELLYG